MKTRLTYGAIFVVLLAAVIVSSTVVLAEEVITLRINTPMVMTDPSTPILEEYLREYERLNPHIRIENEGRDHSLDSLVTTFAAGAMVDIVSHSTGTLYELYKLGMLALMPEEMEARLREQVFPVIADELTVDGRMIGVPKDRDREPVSDGGDRIVLIQLSPGESNDHYVDHLAGIWGAGTE